MPPIRHEFHQRAVRIAEIDAGALALGAEPLRRPGVDRDVVVLQMRNGVLDRTRPLKAQIAVAGLHRQARHLGRADALAVDVELLIAEAVGPADWPLHQLRAHHIAVEGIGPLPVRDMDDAVIEICGNSHPELSYPPSVLDTPSVLPTRSATTRRCSLSAAPRPRSKATISADAVSVDPQSNGG